MSDVLELFSAPTRAWFSSAFDGPTPAQEGAWRAASEGGNALVIAPTGSGKTLAAFLLAVDRLANRDEPPDPKHRCQVLYVSPLKALAVDVQRNLREPLAGIELAARELGVRTPEITVGMRTGDTPATERAKFTRAPQDILVTTPESLYLLLTSAARESLRGIRTVIVDEVHAVAATKRGAHLALSLERLDDLLPEPAQRIGLSATVRPVDEVAAFLAGGRPVQVVRPPTPKSVQVSVEVPVEDMTQLPVPEEGNEAAPVGSEIGPQEETTGAPVRRPSIWPSVERRIYELVTAHRSTIVFTNSRRLSERLTTRLNELHAGEPELTTFPAQAPGQSGVTTAPPAVIAKAHHGSMAREQRLIAEEELKAGVLPCVVATSSLELGIDMGAVDLVVQVEPPPTVASGLQRVGRAGHHVGAVSTGVMFPKLRGELAGCAVVAERMSAGSIEAIRYPRNPLDVLAQQIVAMVAAEPMTVEHMARVVRGAAPFGSLPEDALHAVLDMLSGRYPSADFAELRPRITWDRTTGELQARPGAKRLAVTSGGTIPDRGLYTVMTAASEHQRGSRVGELDEEMVHESRVGDTILLGTSTWRITDITHDRVIVAPAPGQPARMPFWKGETVGRPLELGQAVGEFVREVGGMDEEAARERISRTGMDDWAVDNLLAYLEEQRAATGHVPDDRTIVLERYRDELGDWRVIVHSPFGAQVNAPWALAIAAGLRQRKRVDAQVMHSDDGIVLRLPDMEGTAASIIRAEDIVLDPELVDDILRTEVSSSALFAARFRECAARSLLLPRRDPRRRQPLWQQRQRAGQLLTVAADYDRFPVVLESMRECLQDVYDVAGLRSLMSGIAARTVRVVEVQTPSASPFARSLLFGYVGEFLYNTDTPLAERRAAALALDSTLLAELLGSESLRELLDAEVIAGVQADLQHLPAERHARGVEGTADLLRTLGDLTPGEAAARGVAAGWLAELESAGRAIRVRVAGEERVAAVEDAARLRDGLGVVLPEGLPAAFLEPVPDPVPELLARYARRHGPFTAGQAAERFGLGVAVVVEVLDRLTANGVLVRGELRPESGGGPPDYCDAVVLRRIRRACLARLRAEVEPVDPAALGTFLPAWHGITPRASARQASADDLLGCIEQLAGAPIPASALESLVLPARLPGYTPGLLDELTTNGEVTWCGCGSLPGGDGWVALAPSDVADLLLPDIVEPPEGEVHAAIVSALDGGALFFRELVDRVHKQLDSPPLDDEVVTALWELVWAGLVSGDSIAGLRATVSGGGATHRPRRTAPRGRYARLRSGALGASVPARPRMPSVSGPPTVSGRWALVPAREKDPTRRAHARTESFLERHGVLTRGALDTERVSGGFAGIYQVLRQMSESGQVIRGYVVDGLGAAQFAARGAVDRLRASTGEDRAAIVLAATDPAQPYGAALPWPSPVGETVHRPGRKAGALVALVGGRPALYLERGGKSLLSFTTESEPLTAAANAVAELVRAGRLEPIAVRRADGEQVLTSELAVVLRAAGFRPTPQGLRLR